MRDGEQSPGIALRPEQKAALGEQLERLGVDVIEAGFAVASTGDFEGVRAVADAVKRPTVVNLPDTVGYCWPDEYAAFIKEVCVRCPELADVTLSAHCHDDLGLAVANSLAGVAAGASQVECTVNGIGERAGNAALEEVVMALKVKRDLFGVATGIDTRELGATSRLVEQLTG